MERLTDTPHLPILLPLRQPPVSQAFASSLNQFEIKHSSPCPDEIPREIMGYAGHFVLVGVSYDHLFKAIFLIYFMVLQ